MRPPSDDAPPRARPASNVRSGERRSLSHVGGAVTTSGDPALSASLARALSVSSSIEAEEQARAHVHGFHSYPARMHPLTAHRLIEELGGARVLDPFCGSGTVLVEAALLGRAAIGVDANPLAVRLAELKTRATTEAQRDRLVARAEEIATTATARRKARSGASRRYPRDDVALFAPHVLLELDGLRVGLEAMGDDRARADLELVLSAILTKVSRRSGDTRAADDGSEKRVAAGYPTRLFVAKTRELTQRMSVVAGDLARAPKVRVIEGDARALDLPAASIDLVVTSPPYPGNYDYLAHHAARLRWLGLDEKRFDEREIGARRKLERLDAGAALSTWRRDLSAVLASLRRVLAANARVVMLLADSVVGGGSGSGPAPLFAIDALDGVAPREGFRRVAVASQPRPHFHQRSHGAFARRPRGEHAILLTRS